MINPSQSKRKEQVNKKETISINKCVKQPNPPRYPIGKEKKSFLATVHTIVQHKRKRKQNNFYLPKSPVTGTPSCESL